MVLNLGFGHMVEIKVKNQALLIILAISTFCFGSTVLERKVISAGKIDCSNIRSLDIFLTKDGNVSVFIKEHNLFLYTNNTLITIDKEYGDGSKYFINAFAENDRIKFAYCPIVKEIWPGTKSIDIYDVLKQLDKPAESIKIPEEMQNKLPGEIIAIPQVPDKYYIAYTEEKFTPAQYFAHFLSGGHGFGSAKPYLAEIENGRISRYEKVKYGGKRIEDFFTKEIISDGKMIHYLGFRSEPGHQGAPLNTPVILYYAGYDLKKREVAQSYNVYEINCDPGSYDFGPLSMTGKDDKVFVVFSFHKYPFRGAPHNDFSQIKSDIYYFQYGNKSAGNAEKIAKGFIPLVKLDSVGNVYVFWMDYKGNLFYKTKEKDKWSAEKIILTDVDILLSIISMKYVSMEFDSKNNLHIVFPSNGNLTYAKVRLD
jgi:hypothetical protein